MVYVLMFLHQRTQADRKRIILVHHLCHCHWLPRRNPMLTAVFAKKPGPKLVVVSNENRTAVFVEKNVLIPPGNRCCPAHLRDGVFTRDAVKHLPTTENVFLNRTTITELLQNMRTLCQRNEKRCLDFDDAKNLTDTDYKSLLGISKENFQEICISLQSFVKNTPARSLITSVAIFFCKMKTGLSNVILST